MAEGRIGNRTVLFKQFKGRRSLLSAARGVAGLLSADKFLLATIAACPEYEKRYYATFTLSHSLLWSPRQLKPAVSRSPQGAFMAGRRPQAHNSYLICSSLTLCWVNPANMGMNVPRRGCAPRLTSFLSIEALWSTLKERGRS